MSKAASDWPMGPFERVASPNYGFPHASAAPATALVLTLTLNLTHFPPPTPSFTALSSPFHQIRRPEAPHGLPATELATGLPAAARTTALAPPHSPPPH